MFDGLSLLIRDPDTIESIRRNPLLKFKQVGYRRVSESYKGFTFSVSKNCCWVNGSIHKYKNEGKHNADTFYYPDLRDCLEDLYDEFGIDPDIAEIKNLEVGVNVQLNYNPDKFINSIQKRFTRFPSHMNKNIGIEFPYQQYIIKIYSKSKQDKQFKDLNILRFEVRFEKMIKTRKELGDIKYLSDLTNPSFWHQAKRCLYDVFDSLNILDIYKVIEGNMPNKDKLFILEWRYIDAIEACSTKRQRSRDKLKSLAEKYNLYDIKNDVGSLIDTEFNNIFSYPTLKEYCDTLLLKGTLHFNPLSLTVKI